MEDGHIFNLGGRILTVYHTPGHSRGSVCIFDENTGTLFTGDNVQAMATALLEDCATNVSTYLASMEKIACLPVKRICGGHMPPVLTPDYITKKSNAPNVFFPAKAQNTFGDVWAKDT